VGVEYAPLLCLGETIYPVAVAWKRPAGPEQLEWFEFVFEPLQNRLGTNPAFSGQELTERGCV